MVATSARDAVMTTRVARCNTRVVIRAWLAVRHADTIPFVSAVLRFDIGRLDRAKRTGAGGARVPATIARTGVQVYTDQHGRTVREYRPPDAVFAEDSLATLGSIPVTEGHPPNGVTPANHRQLSVGHVSDAPPGKRKDADAEWLESSVVISDADTLRKVESGELTEVSMGYMADVVPESGIAPNGEHYDAVQKNIRFNHLALLKDGHARAGRGARLRLDGNQEPISMFVRNDDAASVAASPKLMVKVDGIDVEKGSDTHISLLERGREAEKKRADEATAALTAAQTELGTAKATIASHKPVDVNALVQDELAFRQSVLPALPKDYKFDGKTRDQVRADAVGPAVMADAAKLGSDAERSGYVAAHLKIKLDAASKAPPALHTPSVVVKDDEDKPAVDPARKAYLDSFGSK